MMFAAPRRGRSDARDGAVGKKRSLLLKWRCPYEKGDHRSPCDPKSRLLVAAEDAEEMQKVHE